MLAFAAWTIVYHVCLVLRIGAVWAGVVAAAALVPCALVAVHSEPVPEPERPATPGADGRSWLPRLVAFNIVAGLGASMLFAFTDRPWWLVWALWALAAAAAVAVTSLRPAAGPPPERPGETPRLAWLTTAVVLAWAGLASLGALLLVRNSEDDTYYVHLSSWVAEHGTFPLRDTLFSDEELPAIIYPPLSSFEAAAGTIARAIGIVAPDLVYYVVAPLVSVLGVLALWRLLRAWQVPLIGVALSAAMVFLLLDAPQHRAFGNTILGRSWHGKVALVAVLVPLLFVLLQHYVERPGKRGLVLLAAAGVTGVGLSSTGVFVVPVVAAGCLAAIAWRAPRRAVVALAAVAAYPLGAGIVTAVVGSRRAQENPYFAPETLLHFVLDDGVLALVAVASILVGPLLIPRATAARMTAATVLLLAVLFTPPVMRALFDVTGLGRVLWRLTWAVPTAALIGVLAVGVGSRFRSPALKVAPAALLCAAFVVWGTPLWSAGQIDFASSPAWKRPPQTVSDARWILSHARPGDVVLAPTETSQTIAATSGDVYTVAPRGFYAAALGNAPGGHPYERAVLKAFADNELESLPGPPVAEDVAAALRLIGVDLACVVGGQDARDVLSAAGYSEVDVGDGVVCARRRTPAR